MSNFFLVDQTMIKIGEFSVKISTVFSILLIVVITKTLIWVIKKILSSRVASKIDQGNSFAVFQIIRYFFWTVALSLILDTAGVDVTLLIAGSAALLVGVGLGLQQTFNDIISGVIILFEGTTKIGDVLEVDGDIIKLQKIGLRTSVGMTRDQITVIIPNSSITNNKVINWSHQSKKIRFHIDVGVAYGSDVEKVILTLEESVRQHRDVVDTETIEIRFVDFGDSSLDFKIFFYSEESFYIERIKSNIRRTIYRQFEIMGITIPFSQMDVHLKNS